MDDKMLSTQEAINLMADGEYIHTFRNPNGMLIGADIKRDEIIKMMDEFGVQLAGDTAKKMKHGLCIKDGSFLFIATKD